MTYAVKRNAMLAILYGSRFGECQSEYTGILIGVSLVQAENGLSIVAGGHIHALDLDRLRLFARPGASRRGLCAIGENRYQKNQVEGHANLVHGFGLQYERMFLYQGYRTRLFRTAPSGVGPGYRRAHEGSGRP